MPLPVIFREETFLQDVPRRTMLRVAQRRQANDVWIARPDQIGPAGHTFAVELFPHSLNVSVRGSDLRVQIQVDRRYTAFLDRAALRQVLGLTLPVASLEDVLQGKVWAVEDVSWRPSKRQKDLTDISRLLEKFPHLRASVPTPILDKLL